MKQEIKNNNNNLKAILAQKIGKFQLAVKEKKIGCGNQLFFQFISLAPIIQDLGPFVRNSNWLKCDKCDIACILTE